MREIRHEREGDYHTLRRGHRRHCRGRAAGRGHAVRQPRRRGWSISSGSRSRPSSRGQMIYIVNTDAPGFIGALGTALGEARRQYRDLQSRPAQGRRRGGRVGGGGRSDHARAGRTGLRQLPGVRDGGAADVSEPLRASGGGIVDALALVPLGRRGSFEQGIRLGQRHRHRRPVGRRGQGQDRRLAGQPRRHGRSLPGRPQCRPHAGRRRRDLQIVAAAVGDRARHTVGHRQWRGARPVGAESRSRAHPASRGWRSRPRC